MTHYSQRLRPTGGIAASQEEPHDWQTRALRALNESRKAVTNWNGRIARPGTGASLLPVVGPAWEAAADFQDGDYGSAAFNTAMAVADALPIGAVLKVGRVMKVLKAANNGRPLSSLTAAQLAKLYTKTGLKKAGEHLHHTIPLGKWDLLPKATRFTPGLIRNHPALLKVMSQSNHHLAHGNNGAGRLRQVWHGTNELEKGVAAGVVGKGADGVEAVTEERQPPPPAARRR
ncbi:MULTISPECIES: hypothetical protein [unclassified Sphingomonas]|uniref:hypothetical protein n=1 Tax=unclassified Sphingomonas TaxID=196159 RepID=UPI0006F6370D|nr:MULTISPECIES: hypothetical protein [unclassified Sphingomonas]KQX25556.1 hypothetical protein ASD17_22570 [Sphingomonas sp. Root1294]KQY66546.1 hypothetical protein ASD39_12370 [Sphingomonas sp. Root50]KRB90132.1 hypothetical protein ASE22_14580 [Sphingomonas sp. Root720]